MTRRELNEAINRARYVFVYATFISGMEGEYIKVSKTALLAALGPARLDRAGKDEDEYGDAEGYSFTFDSDGDLYIN